MHADHELAEMAQALQAGPPPRAPTMGNLAKVSYTHDAMIDLIIARPGIKQKDIALYFGRTPAWISNIFASDAFQARLADRRKEVIDPTLVATVEERMRALTIQAYDVLQTKLEQPQVSDQTALRALELGARALGLGGNAAPKAEPVNLDKLAERLVALRGGQPPALEGEVIEKEVS